MPWKLLLKMGKLKPSPEAIDMFMSSGEKTVEMSKRRILDIAVLDLYWGIITPSQALLMLYGLPPPVPKQIVAEMKRVFVEKEKMLEMRYVNILDKIITLYKDYEHEKVKEIKGAELDKLIDDFDAYMKRLKELQVQIEKRTNEKTIEQIYNDIFNLLKAIFGNKPEKVLITSFEKEFVSKGKFPENYLKILYDLVSARKKFKEGKLAKHEIENARKNAAVLINNLIEYNQRCELVSLEKGRFRIKYGEKTAELIFAGNEAFLIKDRNVFKITDKLVDVKAEDLDKALAEQKGKKEVRFNAKVFSVLKKELGEFEVII